MATNEHQQLEDDSTGDLSPNGIQHHIDHEECFLYDTSTGPTWIENIFGEPYHVKDKYASHRISIRFVLTLASVYIVEGCSDWMMIALRYYGTAIWNIGPSEMQNFRSITTFPWTIKIIYGLTVDTLPLFGYKRKSWMLIFGVLAPLSILVTIIWSKHYYVQLIFFTANFLSVAFCDVIADALTVERTEFKSHGVATRLQSLAWGSRYIASIAGMLISTRIEISNKPKDMLIVYWLYFFISLSIIISAVLLPEDRGTKKRRNSEIELVPGSNAPHPDNDDPIHSKKRYSVKRVLSLTFTTLSRKSIFYPLLFTFILRCTPSSSEALSYFLIYNLGFSSVWIGYLSVAGGIAFLFSIAIITIQSKRRGNQFSLRKTYFWWTVIGAFLPFITLVIVFGWNHHLGIPDIVFMISDTVVVETALDILQMAVNILYARICPPGIEGLFMTVLTSVSNIGLLINYQISSKLTKILGIECGEDPDDPDSVVCDFTYLWLLVVIVNLSTLIPLVLIKKVPNEEELQRIGEKLTHSTDDMLSGKESELERSEMIGLYWITVDYICPFIKRLGRCTCLSCPRRRGLREEVDNLNQMLNEQVMAIEPNEEGLTMR